MMKKKIAMSIGCLVLAGLSGCCNIITRVEGEFAPYACAPHPYYCTAETWPDVALSRTYLCCTAARLAAELWPIAVVDEVFEVACDTVLLPVDLTGLYCRTDEQRKKLAEIRERRKKIAERVARRRSGHSVQGEGDTLPSHPVISFRRVSPPPPEKNPAAPVISEKRVGPVK